MQMQQVYNYGAPDGAPMVHGRWRMNIGPMEYYFAGFTKRLSGTPLFTSALSSVEVMV